MLLVARALREKFDGMIEFAGNGKYSVIFPEAGFKFHEVTGGFSLRQARRLQYERQWSIFDLRAIYQEIYGSLLKVIESEVELYKEVEPDLIVWDGRFTVVSSAEIFGVPFISVANAALMPYNTIKLEIPRRAFLFTRHPGLLFLTRLPEKVQDGLLASLRKWAYRVVLRAHNKIRAAYGLPPYPSMSDFLASLPAVILPDAEIMSPAVNLPGNFHYVGPLVWQPEMELPPSVRELRDVVYITMGSTGSPEVFKPLIAAFSQMPELQAVVTTGGIIEKTELEPLPENVYMYEFLPGAEIAKRARLVICHGAPATVAQALSHGAPIIGIPFNIPQEFSIDRVVSLGAGMKLDLCDVTPERIGQMVRDMLGRDGYREAAARLSPQFNLEDGPRRAADIILRTLWARRANGEGV
jgi:MGT family glycosyltransferase